MTFAPLQFSFHCLSDEVCTLFALVQNGVHALKGALRKAARNLLEIDLFSAHTRNIDDITNCYKPYFSRYQLLQSLYLMISSIHQTWRTQMTTLTLGTAKIARQADGYWIVEFMGMGNWTVGRQVFGSFQPCLRFCRERALSVIDCKC